MKLLSCLTFTVSPKTRHWTYVPGLTYWIRAMFLPLPSWFWFWHKTEFHVLSYPLVFYWILSLKILDKYWNMKESINESLFSSPWNKHPAMVPSCCHMIWHREPLASWLFLCVPLVCYCWLLGSALPPSYCHNNIVIIASA